MNKTHVPTDQHPGTDYWLACAQIATALRRDYAEQGDILHTDMLRTIEGALWTVYALSLVGQSFDSTGTA